MYSNPSRKKTNRFKVSLSDFEQREVDAAVEIDGGERAVIARELLMSWAKSVIHSAQPQKINGSQPGIGIVNPDGGIRYRLAA